MIRPAVAGDEEWSQLGARAGTLAPAGLGLLRELLASLPAAVAYVAGPDLVFEFASDGYRQAVGGRDLIGRPFREALPEVVGQPPFEALRQVLRDR